MSSMRHVIALAAVFAITSISTTEAQRWPQRFSDQRAQNLLSRIDTRTKFFKASLDRAIDRSQINGSPVEARINQSVTDFKQATDRLRGRVSEGRADSTDVTGVLRPGSSIDQFMTAHPLNASAQRDWQNLRRDLDELAHAHGVTWYWSSSQYLRS